jgi:hypothetical protein
MACTAGLLTGDGGGSMVATRGKVASMASPAQILDKRQGGGEVQI